MITKEYSFHAPQKLEEAIALLQHYGEDAKLLAGGVSLVPLMTLGLVQPEALISLKHIRELDYVREAGDHLRIGAMTRHDRVRADSLIRQHCPVLAEAAGFIGDPQVRHRGTIGGSLAHADPAADYPPVMLVLNALLRIRNQNGERTVAATDFFKGLLQTDLGRGEILTEVVVPKLAKGSGSAYRRLHRVEGSFAIVASAAVIEPGFKAARVGLSGVGPKAVLLDVTRHLAGGVSDEALQAIARDTVEASADAYGDLNGDAEYRREMAKVYAKRAIKAAAEATT
ncbi:MAG: xanthine dehydrogenase family protein subunit M [Candidatus Binatia bacterium]